MTTDTLLNACALLELVERQDGNTMALDDAVALLAGERCTHAAVALYLAGALVNLCRDAGFNLTEFIDAERREAIAVEDPPDMA